MKNKRISISKLLPWLLVILWMALIFLFSHQPATKSSELSSGITEQIINIIIVVAPNSSNKTSQIDISYIVRKGAHFTIYLVLGILVSNSIIKSNVEFKRNYLLLALLICFLYAISDELHQLFIPGRSGEVKDVLIDSTGALVGILLMKKLKTKHSSVRTKESNNLHNN